MLIAVGVLQAIAVGTFIYVTFFEILSEELADHSSVGKVLFVVVGFMLMALLDLVPEEQIQIQQSPQHMDFSSNSSGLLNNASNSTSWPNTIRLSSIEHYLDQPAVTQQTIQEIVRQAGLQWVAFRQHEDSICDNLWTGGGSVTSRWANGVQ